MKYLLPIILLLSLKTELLAQGYIKGYVYYQNSNKKPAFNVKINATGSNGFYSGTNGEYELYFPSKQNGTTVKLTIGDTLLGKSIDGDGKEIEVVNEVDWVTIPSNPNLFKTNIIICYKGSRDEAAKRYYKIFKTNTLTNLKKLKYQFDSLSNERNKDFRLISKLSKEISFFEDLNDSIKLWKEAFYAASINRDFANKRVINYLNDLDNGISVKEARKHLNREKAVATGQESIRQYNKAIEELELNAKSAFQLFNYDEALSSYEDIIMLSEQLGIDSLIVSKFYINAGEVAYREGNLEKAIGYQSKALNIRKKRLPNSSLSVAFAYNNLGLSYMEIGDYDKAVEYLQNGLNLKNDLSISTSFNNLGLCYQEMGYFQMALKYHLSALEIQKRYLSDDNLELGHYYNNIGLNFSFLDEKEKAVIYYKKAINVYSRFGDNNHFLGIAYDNLGGNYRDLGKIDSALFYHMKAIIIFRNSLDSNHRNLATAYLNIGETYEDLDSCENALDYKLKALAINRSIRPTNYFKVAQGYDMIAKTFICLGLKDSSLVYLSKSLSIIDNNNLISFEKKAQRYSAIGSIYRDMANNEDALTNFKKALANRLKVFDSTHSNIISSLIEIGYTYKQMGKYDSALFFHQRVTEILEIDSNINQEYKNMNNYLLFENHLILAKSNFKNKHYSKALTNFNYLANYYGGKKSPVQITIHNYIGLCYYYLKKFPEAIQAYNQAETFGLESDIYLNNIGTAYVKNKQFKKARAAFNELQKLIPEKGITYRNWAMYYALQNEDEKALTSIQKAVDLGYNDLQWLESDDSMNSIRNKKEYQGLIDRLKDIKE